MTTTETTTSPESGKTAPIVLCDEGVSNDDPRVKEANRRLKILEAYWAQLAQGKGRIDAAKATGCPYTNIWRWEKAHKAKGFNGLVPETANCGRASCFEKLGFTRDQVEAIRNEVRGINLDSGSVTSALRTYAHSDRCPAELARVILDPNRCSKHALPPSLRAAAYVTKLERKAHRGPRQLSLGGIWIPRKMDIIPGDVFSSDDTTPIWAWWVPWVESEEYPFGVKLLQGQYLPLIDVCSQKTLCYALIAREQSSYRAGDIWGLFGHAFDQVGLPRLGFQLERGSWESNKIAGQRCEVQDGEVSWERRVGGLRQLPTNVTDWHRQTLGADFTFPKTLQTWTSYLPKSKSIEAAFNRMQSLEGTLWGSLGRDQQRAPYEKAKKLYNQCRAKNSKVDPRNHFLSQTEMAARLNEIVNYLNNEPMEGEVFSGIPCQKFDQAVSERLLFRLPDDLRWLYRRDWQVVTITQGWARVRLTHPLSGDRYSLFYCNPERFGGRDEQGRPMEGREVAVYYDVERFQEPAQIVDVRTGDYLCDAEYVDRKGSFLAGDLTGLDIAKRHRAAVMTVYGTMAKHAPSRQLPPEIAQRRADARAGQTPRTAPVADIHQPSTPQLSTASSSERNRLENLASDALAAVPD